MGNDNPKSFDPNQLSPEAKRDFDLGKPMQPAPGVKITKNPVTGKL